MKNYRQIAIATVTAAMVSMFSFTAQAGVDSPGQGDAPSFSICRATVDIHTDTQLNACGGNRRGGHGPGNGNGNGGSGPKNRNGNGLKASVYFRF